MSDLKNNNYLKVDIIRASGKKTESKIAKIPRCFYGVSLFSVQDLKAELLTAFEFALLEAKRQGKNEISIKFNI